MDLVGMSWVGWSIGWLVGWWLVPALVGRSICWFVGWSVCWLVSSQPSLGIALVFFWACLRAKYSFPCSFVLVGWRRGLGWTGLA
jgi:hypothetical protein